MSEASPQPGPLRGIKVLDFTRVVSGPFATLALSDLGAEVIKVEQPGLGDDSRHFGPPWIGDTSTYFVGLNRGKKSVTLDLKQDADRARARQLAAEADVLVENFRSGFMDRAGLGYADLVSANPRLIYSSLTAFGDDGPYRDRAGYDVMVAALGGLMSITGYEGQPPVKPGVALLDVCTGLFALAGITSALYERERSGRGQRVEVSLMGTQLSVLINAASAYLLAGVVAGPQGTAHPSIVPYQLFHAADGWVLIGAPSDRLFARFAAGIGHPEWVTDARFATNPQRVAHRDLLIGMIDTEVSARPVDEIVELLADAGVAVAPVNTIDRAFADPQVQAMGIVGQVEDQVLGPLAAVRTPLNFSRTPVRMQGPAAALGQHGAEGFSG